MNSVVFITIISIWLFIPLGVLKGLIVRFFAPIKSIYYSVLVNIILHLLGVFLFCYGGYCFSKIGLINYDFSLTFNLIVIISIGIILFCVDAILTRKILLVFPEKSPIKIKYFMISWWIIYSSIYSIPLLMPNNISSIENNPTIFEPRKNIDSLSAESVYEKFFDKKLTIHSYPYGGVVVEWDNRKKILNHQTFFYRWSPGVFYFDSNSGKVIFRVDQEMFSYDIEKDKLLTWIP